MDDWRVEAFVPVMAADVLDCRRSVEKRHMLGLRRLEAALTRGDITAPATRAALAGRLA